MIYQEGTKFPVLSKKLLKCDIPSSRKKSFHFLATRPQHWRVARKWKSAWFFCTIESHGLFQDRETLILSCCDSWEPVSTHAGAVFKLPSRLQPLSFVQKSFNDFSWWDKKRQLPHFKAQEKTPRSRSITISRYETSNPIESDGLVGRIRQ